MNHGLTIVITMAGLGTRFRQVGYSMPKYQIIAKQHSLFYWSIKSLVGFHDMDPRYIFLVRSEDQANDFIAEECRKIGINDYNVIELSEATDGQATTALLAQEYWDENSALLVYNIDTYVEGGEMCSKQLKGDGFLPCFQGEGDHWSFVALDETGKAVEVREKKRISENCTLGAYYFSSCKLYEELYEEYFVKNKNSDCSERYIAPLYNQLIAQNRPVYISTVDKKFVHPLGTPAELNSFLEK